MPCRGLVTGNETAMLMQKWKVGKGCDQIHLRLSGRHLGARLGPVDIHLTPDAERTRQVYPRLDREADARNELPVVVGLVVIDVRSRAVQVAVDRVPGPVNEGVAISRALDHRSRGPVRLVAGNGTVVG